MGPGVDHLGSDMPKVSTAKKLSRGTVSGPFPILRSCIRSAAHLIKEEPIAHLIGGGGFYFAAGLHSRHGACETPIPLEMPDLCCTYLTWLPSLVLRNASFSAVDTPSYLL